MKTKHLFFATALVASFASCTNEEIVEQQGVANVERPTVENVQLNFVGEGVDSRLAFGSNGYAWEANDVIGALLMDTPSGSATTAYWNKYVMTDYINTSYPFSYDAEEGTWGTPGKMLEGNYFFTFPWSDFNGERTPLYSLTAQKQNGVKGAAVAESYAENQVFVGYSPILKGTGFDVLTDVEMTSLLGAVQLRIKNEGEKTYHINKIVLKGSKVSSTLTIDPTGATDAQTDDFAVADYLGKDFKGLTTTKDELEAEDFAEYRMAALREVAKYSENESVQLNVNGTEAERAVAPGKTAYALIMVNPIDFYTTDAEGEYTTTRNSNTLTADIYTDEGKIVTIDLTTETGNANVEDGYVKSTKPGVANTVVISFEDKDVEELDELNVYTEEDLLQLINWNINKTKKTPIKATLADDIELTKEAFDLLKSNDKLTLKVLGSKTLTLAADLPADVLEYDNLKLATVDATDATKAGVVEIAGTINFTTNTNAQTVKFVVAEGATVNINVLNAIVPEGLTIAEGGKLNVGAAAKVNNKVAIVNNGIATVDGLIQGAFTNNGTLNLNGTAANVDNEGIINMGATSKLLKGTNTNANNKEAVINMVSGATLSYINSSSSQVGRVKYVDGAIITYTGTGAARTTTVYGEVFVEVGDIQINADKYKEKGVNLWVLTDDIEITAGVTLNKVEIAEGADITLTVKTDSLLTVTTNLTVKKEASLLTVGNIKADGVIVEADAEWTNNGTATVITTLTNNGSINNNGIAQAGTDKETTLTGVESIEGTVITPNTGKGTWLQNPFVQKAIDEKAEALVKAVTDYVNTSDAYKTAKNGKVVVAEFIAEAKRVKSSIKEKYANIKAYYNTYMAGEEGENPTQTEIDAAVVSIKTANVTALNTLLADVTKCTVIASVDATFYLATTGTNAKTAQEKAYETLVSNIVNGSAVSTLGTTTVTNAQLMAAEKLTATQIAAILVAHKLQCAYIWDGCNMEKLMQVWFDYSDALASVSTTSAEYTVADAKVLSLSTTEDKLAKMITNWAFAIYSTTSTDNDGVKDAITAIKAAGYTGIATNVNFNGFTDSQVRNIWSSEKGLKQTSALGSY